LHVSLIGAAMTAPTLLLSPGTPMLSHCPSADMLTE